MLHLPAKGQPRPHPVLLALGMISSVSVGWVEISGPDEHPIVGAKLAYWLGIALVSVLVARRMKVPAPGHGRIRMLQIASARVWIGGSLLWLALLVAPLVWSPPDGSLRHALPLVTFLSIFPVATILHLAWELLHPVDEPGRADAPAADDATVSIRKQGIIVVVITTGAALVFGRDLTAEYARHGASDARFVALSVAMGCIVTWSVLAVISLATGRPLWGWPPSPGSGEPAVDGPSD